MRFDGFILNWGQLRSFSWVKRSVERKLTERVASGFHEELHVQMTNGLFLMDRVDNQPFPNFLQLTVNMDFLFDR